MYTPKSQEVEAGVALQQPAIELFREHLHSFGKNFIFRPTGTMDAMDFFAVALNPETLPQSFFVEVKNRYHRSDKFGDVMAPMRKVEFAAKQLEDCLLLTAFTDSIFLHNLKTPPDRVDLRFHRADWFRRGDQKETPHGFWKLDQGVKICDLTYPLWEKKVAEVVGDTIGQLNDVLTKPKSYTKL